MMIEVNWGPYRLRCDPEATRLALEAVAQGAPELCACAACRNFIAARALVYTEPHVALLEQLGVRPGKEAEVYTHGEMESGLHRFEGFTHFVGELLEGRDAPPWPITEHVSLWLQSTGIGLVPATFGEVPLVQVEFIAELPWLIEDPPPGFRKAGEEPAERIS